MNAAFTHQERTASVLVADAAGFAALSGQGWARAPRRERFAPALTVINLVTWAWAAWSGGLALT